MASRQTRSGTRRNSNEPQIPTPGPASRTPRTPAGRRQKTGERELPALTPNISSAYGGAGRATLAESLRNQQDTTTFAEQLESERAEAEEDVAPLPRRSSRISTPRHSRASSVVSTEHTQTPRRSLRSKKGTPRNAPLQSVHEESSNEESEQDTGAEAASRATTPQNQAREQDATTLLENDRSYAEAANLAQRARVQPSPSSGTQVRVSLIHRLKASCRSIYGSIQSNLPNSQRLIAIIILFLAIFGSLGLFLSADTTTDIAGLHPINSVQHYGSMLWQNIPAAPRILTGQSYHPDGYPDDLAREVSRIKGELKRLTEASSIHESTIDELNRILPDSLVVKENDNGRLEIPEQFWRALKEKMDLSFGDRDSAPSWEAFLARNKAELQDMLSSEVNYAIQSATSAKTIASHSELVSLLRENYAALSSEIARVNDSLERRYNSILATSTDTAISSTRKTIAEELKQIPAAQLNSIASANMLRNSELALKNINFFSFSMGAIIDPFLTSSTLTTHRPSSVESLYRRVFNTRTNANPPISALEPWQEAGDCWCAASTGTDDDDDGQAQQDQQDGGEVRSKAQIAVILPHAIFPNRVTIEHVPRDATLDIGAAPKKLELWVSVPNDEQRELVGLSAERFIDTSDSGASSFHPDGDANTASSRGKSVKPSKKGSDRALDDTYVKVAEWEYDIYSINHVQTIPVEVPFADLVEGGVSVSRMAVRATSNWGSKHTCFYRVRMHGKVAGGE